MTSWMSKHHATKYLRPTNESRLSWLQGVFRTVETPQVHALDCVYQCEDDTELIRPRRRLSPHPWLPTVTRPPCRPSGVIWTLSKTVQTLLSFFLTLSNQWSWLSVECFACKSESWTAWRKEKKGLNIVHCQSTQLHISDNLLKYTRYSNLNPTPLHYMYFNLLRPERLSGMHL